MKFWKRFNLLELLTLIAMVAILSALLIPVTTGCSTTAVTSTTNSTGVVTLTTNATAAANFANALIGTNGIVTAVANTVVTAETTKLVSSAIVKDPTSKQYFLDAQTVLQVLINNGTVTPANLSAALAQIPVKGLAASIINGGITSLLGAYQQADALTVSQKINAVPYLGAFLGAVNTGITAALQ